MLAQSTIITKLNNKSFNTSWYIPLLQKNVSLKMSLKKKYVANRPANKANT